MDLKQYLIGKDINTAIKYLETKCNGKYIGADESESDNGYEEYFYATDKYVIILGFKNEIISNVRFDTLNNLSKYEPVFESKKASKQTIKLNESQLRKIVAESVKKVLKEYNQNVEDWWRHNGNWDRAQASEIPYNGESDYLQKTDNWWESLSDEEKIEIYNQFFDEMQ